MPPAAILACARGGPGAACARNLPRRSAGGLVQCILALLLPATAVAETPEDLFEKHVRPLLLSKCTKCHSDEKSESGLKLTSRQGLMTGGDSGPAIVPGEAAKSLLVSVIKPGGDFEMPPDGPLAGEEVAAVEQWIDSGAVWPGDAIGGGPRKTRSGEPTDEERQHWAYHAPVDPPVPQVAAAGGAAVHPIDAFIRVKLAEKGIAQVGPADKRTLLRRVTYDLTGLPPAPADLDSFEGDRSPDAFTHVVERLLASPAYGERWGRHWLDLVRYADTAGETGDYPATLAWKYRNYVIAAFNADKPYDRFLREQLAGDLLADPANPTAFAEAVTATGFLAITRRFGFDTVDYMHLAYHDMIDTVSQATIGLSVGCARCHDHKYDAITAADYYALYGIFESTKLSFPGDEQTKRPRDMVPLLPPDQIAAPQRAFEARLAVTERLLKEAEAEKKAVDEAVVDAKKAAQQPTAADKPDVAALTAQAKALEARVKELTKQHESLKFAPPFPTAYGAVEGTPKNAKIQKRGEPTRLGDEVPRRFLTVLGGQTVPAEEKGSGRRQLAEWITSPSNPLTARVIVNRVWQHHFGEGLVASENDFGVRGAAPTHPELLDWLACRFVENGWSIKWLHRLILSSETYARASTFDAAAADPDNSLLWRFRRRRLSAEEIRDSLLVLGGTLDQAPGEEHPFPPVPEWGFTQHNPFADLYDSPKRSIYLMTPRLGRHPFLALFDGADANASTPHRAATTVPTQALFWMNAPLVHEQSLAFAARLLAEPDAAARVALAYREAFGRRPTEAEQAEAANFVAQYRAALDSTDIPAADRDRQAWAGFTRTMFAANEFLHVD